MQCKQCDSKILLRIERGEEIVETITNLLKQQNIHAGSISGIGAASKVTLRYYSIKDRQYKNKEFEGNFEIVSLSGNASLMDGEAWPHLHIILTNTDYNCFGGHLKSAIVSATCEIVIDTIDATIERAFDEEAKLKLWSL